MPLYTYQCYECERNEDHVFRMMEERPESLKCSECGGVSRRIYKPVGANIFREYVTEHITGEPIYVSTRQQEAEVCRKHGMHRACAGEFEGLPKKPKPKPMEPLSEAYERTRHEMGFLS